MDIFLDNGIFVEYIRSKIQNSIKLAQLRDAHLDCFKLQLNDKTVYFKTFFKFE